MTGREPDDSKAPEPAAGSVEAESVVKPGAVPASGAERGRRRHRRVVRRGTEVGAVSGVSTDERTDGWSEQGAASRDADLLRDLPPHWGGAGYRD